MAGFEKLSPIITRNEKYKRVKKRNKAIFWMTVQRETKECAKEFPELDVDVTLMRLLDADWVVYEDPYDFLRSYDVELASPILYECISKKYEMKEIELMAEEMEEEEMKNRRIQRVRDLLIEWVEAKKEGDVDILMEIARHIISEYPKELFNVYEEEIMMRRAGIERDYNIADGEYGFPAIDFFEENRGGITTYYTIIDKLHSLENERRRVERALKKLREIEREHPSERVSKEESYLRSEIERIKAEIEKLREEIPREEEETFNEMVERFKTLPLRVLRKAIATGRLYRKDLKPMEIEAIEEAIKQLEELDKTIEKRGSVIYESSAMPEKIERPISGFGLIYLTEPEIDCVLYDGRVFCLSKYQESLLDKGKISEEWFMPYNINPVSIKKGEGGIYIIESDDGKIYQMYYDIKKERWCVYATWSRVKYVWVSEQTLRLFASIVGFSGSKGYIDFLKQCVYRYVNDPDIERIMRGDKRMAGGVKRIDMVVEEELNLYGDEHTEEERIWMEYFIRKYREVAERCGGGEYHKFITP